MSAPTPLHRAIDWYGYRNASRSVASMLAGFTVGFMLGAYWLGIADLERPAWIGLAALVAMTSLSYACYRRAKYWSNVDQSNRRTK